jgi:putative iron-only hydrogenase system regulator
MIFCNRFSATKRNRMSVPGIGLMPGNFLAGEKTGNIFRPVRKPGTLLRIQGFRNGERTMERRIAIVSMILQNPDAVADLNAILHDYQDCIIGRMGIPYRPANVHLISVAVDAAPDQINAMTGRLGRLDGVSAKTMYSDVHLPEKKER